MYGLKVTSNDVYLYKHKEHFYSQISRLILIIILKQIPEFNVV
jgi:hypothetical protein